MNKSMMLSKGKKLEATFFEGGLITNEYGNITDASLGRLGDLLERHWSVVGFSIGNGGIYLHIYGGMEASLAGQV